MFSNCKDRCTVLSMQSGNNTRQEKCLKSFCLPGTNGKHENVRCRMSEVEINDS